MADDVDSGRQALVQLAHRLRGAELEPEHRGALSFRLYRGEGWVTSTTSEVNVRLLCDLWNNRKLIATALLSSGYPA